MLYHGAEPTAPWRMMITKVGTRATDHASTSAVLSERGGRVAAAPADAPGVLTGKAMAIELGLKWKAMDEAAKAGYVAAAAKLKEEFQEAQRAFEEARDEHRAKLVAMGYGPKAQRRRAAAEAGAIGQRWDASDSDSECSSSGIPIIWLFSVDASRR